MKQFSESPAAAQLSRAGSLGSHLESFVSTAADLGYSRSSVRAKLCLLGNFERWLKKKRLRVTDLQERLLEQFLDKRRRESRLAKGDPRTLQQFLDHLRENGVVQRPVPSIDVSPLGTIRARYEEYLRKQRGLSPLTIRDRWPFIQAFLDKRFGSGAIHLRDLTAADVSHFLLRQAHESTPQMLRRMVTALRSFFRFLCQRGEVATDLAGAIPMVRAYRLAGLPKYLKPAEVRRVLDACERTTAVGRRDRAVILLLARLGLRAGEVVGAAQKLTHLPGRIDPPYRPRV